MYYKASERDQTSKVCLEASYEYSVKVKSFLATETFVIEYFRNILWKLDTLYAILKG